MSPSQFPILVRMELSPLDVDSFSLMPLRTCLVSSTLCAVPLCFVQLVAMRNLATSKRINWFTVLVLEHMLPVLEPEIHNLWASVILSQPDNYTRAYDIRKYATVQAFF